MKIESRQLKQVGEQSENETKVFMLKVTGDVDRNNNIVRLAREMIRAKASPGALDSFDAAVNAGLLRSDR